MLDIYYGGRVSYTKSHREEKITARLNLDKIKCNLLNRPLEQTMRKGFSLIVWLLESQTR